MPEARHQDGGCVMALGTDCNDGNGIVLPVTVINMGNYSLIQDQINSGRYRLRLEVWGGGHQRQARLIAAALNGHDALTSSANEAIEALSYAIRGTSDAEQSDKYAATITRLTDALDAAEAANA